MRGYKTLLAFILFFTFSTNGFTQESKSVIHQVVVLEVEQVSSYTYLLVEENNDKVWLAVPTVAAEIGDVLYYKGGMEMTEFKSKELNKTFASVLFIGKVGKTKADLEDIPFKHSTLASHLGNSEKTNEKMSISIDPLVDGISIADLMKDKKLYEGKTVKIKGQVTRFNAKIMSKNWIHLQDGTEFQDAFDLTFTSNATVKVGDTVVLEGIVSLDKDFGYGYFYNLIVENAILID